MTIRERIRALREEARQAGDDEQVAICDLALSPGEEQRAAWIECIRVLEEAEAAREEEEEA